MPADGRDEDDEAFPWYNQRSQWLSQLEQNKRGFGSTLCRQIFVSFNARS